jgi:uncharacterized protein YktB (UPF0637 family)
LRKDLSKSCDNSNDKLAGDLREEDMEIELEKVDEEREKFLKQCPPDFQAAKDHGKANKVRELDLEKLKTGGKDFFCPC